MKTKIIGKSRTAYKLGDFRDFVTLIHRIKSLGQLNGSLSSAVSYDSIRYPIKAMMLFNIDKTGASPSNSKVSGQAVDEVIKHTAVLNTWPKTLDCTWRIECNGIVYAIRRIERSHDSVSPYLVLGLAEVGIEDNKASLE